MIGLDCADSFATWRQQARWLLRHQVDPSRVSWATRQCADLFAGDEGLPQAPGPCQVRVPAALLPLLEQASAYRGEQRWSLLYEVLWRVSLGDRAAMLAGDELGSELHRRLKLISREAHHLHAFVRFIELPGGPSPVPGIAPEYVAWHDPAHDILATASQHFIGRMGQHRWMIATPRDAVYYDGKQLLHEPQCPASWQALAQGADDPQSELWLAYYSHIFNPARVNPKVMQGHLPTRFWKNLPEGPLIPALIGEARRGKQRDGQASQVAGRPGKKVAGVKPATTSASQGPAASG